VICGTFGVFAAHNGLLEVRVYEAKRSYAASFRAGTARILRVVGEPGGISTAPRPALAELGTAVASL